MIAGTATIYLLTRASSGLLSVLTLSIFARGLAPEGYAQWSLVTATSGFFVGALMQPIQACLARFLPDSAYTDVAPTLGRVMAVLLLLLMCSGAIVWWVAPSWFFLPIALFALALGLSQSVFDFTAQYCSSALNPIKYSFLYSSKSLITVGLGAGLLWCGAGVSGAVMATVCGSLFATVFFGVRIWSVVWRGKFLASLLAPLAQYGLPIALSFFCGLVLQWSDRYVLIQSVQAEQRGTYAVIGDFVQMACGMLFSAAHLAFFPLIVRAWHEDRKGAQKIIQNYAEASLLIVAPLAFGSALVSGPIVHALFGATYTSDAEAVMPWLLMAAVAAYGRMYLFDLPFHLENRMNVVLLIVGIAAVLSITLNVVFVPTYGVRAAAVVAAASQIFAALCSAIVGRTECKIDVSRRVWLALLTSLCTIWLLVQLFQPVGMLDLALLALVLLCAHLGLLLVFDVSGIRAMCRRFFKSC